MKEKESPPSCGLQHSVGEKSISKLGQGHNHKVRRAFKGRWTGHCHEELTVKTLPAQGVRKACVANM